MLITVALKAFHEIRATLKGALSLRAQLWAADGGANTLPLLPRNPTAAGEVRHRVRPIG
jgi:hypothetical protein